METVVAGIDIGTTGVKVLVFAEDGKVVAAARRGYALVQGQGDRCELNPDSMRAAVEDAIREATSSAGRGSVRALAASVLGEAITPVDKANRPLDNTVTALDRRAAKQVERFSLRIDADRFHRISGQALHPIASLFKIMWWKDEKPELFSNTNKFLCWNEMLAIILGVDPAVSPSVAARTGMMDLGSGDWSEEILDCAGLDRGILPRIAPTGNAVGIVPDSTASMLGLARGCIVAMGAWDQVCATLGSGAIREGTVVDSMGSTDSLNAVYASPRSSGSMRASGFTCTPALPAGMYCTNAFSLGGANLLSWFRTLIDEGEPAAGGERRFLDRAIEEARASRSPALVLPHFAGSGTPTMDHDSLGAMAGLALGSKRSDLVQGLVEGIALEMAANLDALRHAGLPVERILAVGGGARNPTLLQLRSDVFGEEITPLLVEEAGCLACGMLAAAALDGATRVEDLAHSWVGKGEPVRPRPEWAAYYRELRSVHASLYPALRTINARLASLKRPAAP